MKKGNLSLRGLEVFRLLAKSGSVQKVAFDTGLSISTVSHHLRSVEDTLGVKLMDHSRRPMVLTPAGAIFSRYVEEGLKQIRKGETELTLGNIDEVRDLRLGIVDDFDSEVSPELAQFLAEALPKCTFKHHTRPSHEILRLLYEQKLDAGVATRPVNDASGLIEYPLLRDPFILATPLDDQTPPEEHLGGQSGLPFLRYSQNQIIGSLIEAHLRRLKISLPNRFELESNPSILGMVAEGSGWAVTTPASYVRAQRFHGRVALHPFPGKGFARTISLFTVEDFPRPMAEMISGSLRRLIRRYYPDQVLRSFTWLAPDFRVLNEGDS